MHKGILADQLLYDHFMVFSVALSLLLCPTLAVKHNSYSKDLMKYFVGKAGELYGDHFIVYNVHSMVHLPRGGNGFFTQVVKRLEDMSKSPLSVEASEPNSKGLIMPSYLMKENAVRPLKREKSQMMVARCCCASFLRKQNHFSGIHVTQEYLHASKCNQRMLFEAHTRMAADKKSYGGKREETVFLAICMCTDNVLGVNLSLSLSLPPFS